MVAVTMPAVPVTAIEARARAAEPRRVLLTVLLWIPYMIGWVARRAWMTTAYAWSAVATGWQEAARPRGGAR